METLEWIDPDRNKTWPAGPWDTEPDKLQWPDTATGLPCLIVRNKIGGLCGYVGVPAGHPWHGKGYDNVDANVHGGLTFAGPCQPGDDLIRVCHVPAAGEPDDVWWLGFDCVHLGDLYPTELTYDSSFVRRGEYRDIGYVKAEVTQLAQQIAMAA